MDIRKGAAAVLCVSFHTCQEVQRNYQQVGNTATRTAVMPVRRLGCCLKSYLVNKGLHIGVDAGRIGL